MKFTPKLSAVIVLVLGIGFLAGFGTARHGITAYRYDGYETVFHHDWPTYGIPVAEYGSTLDLIEHGDTTKAAARLRMFLESATQDGIARYQVASGDNRERIRQVLVKAAEYRQEYPLTLATNDAPDKAFWNEKRVKDTDVFLQSLLHHE